MAVRTININTKAALGTLAAAILVAVEVNLQYQGCVQSLAIVRKFGHPESVWESFQKLRANLTQRWPVTQHLVGCRSSGQ